MRNLKRTLWIFAAAVAVLGTAVAGARALSIGTTPPSLDIWVDATVPVGSDFVIGGHLSGDADQITITVTSDAPGKGKNKTRTRTIVPAQGVPAQPLSESFKALGPTDTTLTITAVATNTLLGMSADSETTTIVVRPSGKK